MDLGINGRLAVVTGATRGIGHAIGRMLESEGVTVLPVARTLGIDVTASEAVDEILTRAGGQPIDILVNNAGTTFMRSLEELSDDDWRDQWELNVMASLRLMRAFVPLMAERGWGRVVNITSSAAKRPSLTNPSYSVTKAAQQSLSRVFADSYAAKGVLVNSVAPGPIETPLWLEPGQLADQIASKAVVSREETLRAKGEEIPLGRFGTEDEIAAVAVFLCSEMAANVTGAAWSADGGLFQTII